MLKRNLVLAFRIFVKHPLSSFITLFGLATGIGCFLLLSLYVYDEYRTDRFHSNYNSIYHVSMMYYVDDQPMFSIPPPAGLWNDLSAIKGVASGTRVFSPAGGVVMADEVKFSESGIAFIDSSWLEVFDFDYLNQNFSFFSDPSKLIISEKMAKKYFGSDDPIGETITIDNNPYIIENIILDSEYNSSLEVNFLISYKKQKDFGIDLDSYLNGHTPYFILIDGEDFKEVQEGVQAMIDKKIEDAPFTVEFTSLKDSYFRGTTNLKYQNAGIRGNKKFFNTFALIAVFILVIAIINYVNLVTARATERSKEVGIKKTIGSGKSGLVVQFLLESLLVTFTAGILAIGLAELFLTYFNLLMVKPVDDSILLSVEFLIIYSTGLFCIAILAGLYPALILSSYNPISAISSGNVKVTSMSWLRNSLITFQFIITTLLVFGSSVVMTQMSFLTDFDLGFDSDQILSVDASPDMQKHIERIKLDLLAITGVEHVSVGNLPGIGWMYSREFKDQTINVAIQKVDEDFVEMAGLTIMEGRSLKATDAGTTNILINQTMRDLLFGDEETSLGQLKDSEAHIIGVVNDFQFSSAKKEVMPLELKIHGNQFGNILLRLSKEGNAQSIVEGLKSVIQKHAPDDILTYNFLDEDYDNQFKAEQLFLSILEKFTLISVLIGAIGLFGLAQFTFIKKLKTISIKKLLGASDSRITQGLVQGLLLPIVIALVAGLPIGHYLMNDWLSDYPNKIDLSWSLFGITIGLVVLISLLTILYQLVGAVRLKPISALRDD